MSEQEPIQPKSKPARLKWFILVAIILVPVCLLLASLLVLLRPSSMPIGYPTRILTTTPPPTLAPAEATPALSTPLPSSTPDPDTLLQQQLAQLSAGQIGYDGVTTATVDIPFTIRAYVVADSSEEAGEIIKALITQDQPAGSSPRVQPVRVSGLMRVRLVAPDARDFEITPLHTEERQLVGGVDPTNWSWSVRPLRTGRDKKLELRVVAIARLPDTGEEITKELPPQIITLSVNVNPSFTLLSMLANYGWLLLLFAAIATGSYVYLRSRDRLTTAVPTSASRGLSADLYDRLRHTLLRCMPFDSDADLRTLFTDARLSPWRNDIPQANTPAARARGLIAYLHQQSTTTGENALVLFLYVLADHTHPADALHPQLLTLADDLERALTARPD